jgi:hypothetical protein
MEHPRAVDVVDRRIRQGQPDRALANANQLRLRPVQRETIFGLAQRRRGHVHANQPRRPGIFDEAHQVVPGATAIVEHDLAVLSRDRHVLEVVEILLGPPPEVPQGFLPVAETAVTRHVEGRPELLRGLWL